MEVQHALNLYAFFPQTHKLMERSCLYVWEYVACFISGTAQRISIKFGTSVQHEIFLGEFNYGLYGFKVGLTPTLHEAEIKLHGYFSASEQTTELSTYFLYHYMRLYIRKIPELLDVNYL